MAALKFFGEAVERNAKRLQPRAHVLVLEDRLFDAFESDGTAVDQRSEVQLRDIAPITRDIFLRRRDLRQGKGDQRLHRRVARVEEAICHANAIARDVKVFALHGDRLRLLERKAADGDFRLGIICAGGGGAEREEGDGAGEED